MTAPIFKDQRELSFVKNNITSAEQGAVALKSIINNPCCMYAGKHCKPTLQFARNALTHSYAAKKPCVRPPLTHPL